MHRANRGDLIGTDGRILVLGGDGFVGSRLIKHFARSGRWKVESLDLRDCDLTCAGSIAILRQKVNAQTCILFCSAIPRSREDSIQSFYQNVQMVENVAAALSSCDFRSLIFCSSVDVYGRPPSEPVITESTRLNPASYYGLSKVVSEYILEKELGYERGLAILRLSGIYALDEADPSVLGTIFNNFKHNRPVRLSGGGKQGRTFLNVLSLAAIIESVFTRRWSGLVNLGSSKSYSLREASDILKRFLSSSSVVEDAPPNGREFDILISNDKAHKEFPEVELLTLEQYLPLMDSPKNKPLS